jgi:DNA modification methylase
MITLSKATSIKTSGGKQAVIFRDLMPEIPSTTYATFGLYKYPAKFIPQVIAYALSAFGQPGMSVLDPFAGYGTVGTAAK